MNWHEDAPVGTVLLREDSPLGAGDPRSPRLVKIQQVHPADWPWTRLTGTPADVPSRFTDLDGWRVQSWSELVNVLDGTR